MGPKHASASKHRRDGVVWYKIKSYEQKNLSVIQKEIAIKVCEKTWRT